MSYNVYAIKGNQEWCDILGSLKEGVGRFGWSFMPTGDLRSLKARVQVDGWDTLTENEKKAYFTFLLELKDGDYVVYINIPEWGKCTIARVTGEYYWDYVDSDFNHRFPVDPESVRTFDRNSNVIHPALKRRLKLQGAYWRIRLKDEFEDLRQALESGCTVEVSPESRLIRAIQPYLLGITQATHKNYPAKDLEDLCATVFRQVPGVICVEVKRGRGDHGADLLVRFSSGLPVAELEREEMLVVQVKSYTEVHWETSAVDDIRRAFAYYHDQATMGLIISTADSSTPSLDAALDELRRESQKPVQLLIGEDVAAFILRYGGSILDQAR